MINIKKIIFFITKSALALITLLASILFFYSVLIYEPSLIKEQSVENQIAKEKEKLRLEEEEEKLRLEEEELQKKISEAAQKITETKKVKTTIQDAIFATIGSRVITQSDILNEIKIILILNGQSYSDENKKQLQQAAIKSTIKRNIKEMEIDKYKSLIFSPIDLDLRLKKMAVNLNMDLDTLKNVFTENEIDFSNIIEQVRIELLWNSLIFNVYKDKLSINQNEIDEQLNLLKNKKEIEEYLISEIIILPIPKDKLESEIKKIKEKIKIEGFEQVAKNISISETAYNGGTLGWVSESVISKKFKSTIINTAIGNVSEPVLLPEGIVLYKVRDKRKAKKLYDLEEMKNELVKSEKTKILNMYSLSHYDNIKRSITINFH